MKCLKFGCIGNTRLPGPPCRTLSLTLPWGPWSHLQRLPKTLSERVFFGRGNAHRELGADEAPVGRVLAGLFFVALISNEPSPAYEDAMQDEDGDYGALKARDRDHHGASTTLQTVSPTFRPHSHLVYLLVTCGTCCAGLCASHQCGTGL